MVNLQELARHAPDSNGGGASSQKRLQEAVLVQQARRNTLREMAGEGGAEGSGAGSEAADRGSNAAARDGVERETHSPNRQVSPSASVPSHLGTQKMPSKSPSSTSMAASTSLRPSLPDPNLSVVNLTELARHQQQPTTSTTQKRLNKINTWKKTKAMKEKYGQSERRASFLSRLLSMLWTNRSYLFVAASVAWLNSRDRLRAEMVRRARGLGEQAKRMRDKVAAEGLDAGLEVMRTTVVRTWSESVSGYFRSRPRTTFGILVIVAFQITKAIVYFRGKSRRDPRDRLQKYPASERKADTYKAAEEDGVEDGNNGSMTTWRGQNDPDSPLKGASLGASVTSSGSIDDLGEIIEHGGLHNLMTELNENGVHFNRKTLQLLRSMRHFACIGDADSAAIYKEMKHVRFERGQIIVRQGDPVTDGMFIVLKGSLTVYRNIYSSDDNSSEKTLVQHK